VASTVRMPREVVHDLSMDLGGTCRGSSEKLTDLVCCCSPKVLTQGPDAMHRYKDSLRLNNQSAEQLQRLQQMVQLLMRQLEKEQERRHSLEDALLESCSCFCACCTTGKCQLPCDSGPGHLESLEAASPAKVRRSCLQSQP